MSRLVLCTLVCLAPRLAGAAGAADTWYLLSHDGGCVSVGKLHEAYPFTKGSSQPAEFLAAFRGRFADATMRPFLQLVREQHAADGTRPDPAVSRSLTGSNAFDIESGAGNVHLVLLTGSLCTAMGLATRP
jgi:hypothetical protein